MKLKTLLAAIGGTEENMKTILLLLMCGLMAGCTIRERIGEDIRVTNEKEQIEVVSHITYVRDGRTGLCFAVLNNNADGFRNTFSIANVPCEKLAF